MYTRVSFYDFQRAFNDANRAENFTYSELEALFNYLEELEEDTGEQIELDVIALCCEFSAYDSPRECAEQYDLDIDEDMDDDEIIDIIRENTTVIVSESGSVIIQNY